MKNLVSFTCILLFGTQMASAVTITGDATVVIERAITASQSMQMNFGTITPIASAGVVTLSAAGTRTSGSLGMFGVSNAGQFSITASPNIQLAITFANGVLNNGANNMIVNNFTSASTPAANTTDASGNLQVRIGSDLQVGASQTPGTYTGTYQLTVSY